MRKFGTILFFIFFHTLGHAQYYNAANGIAGGTPLKLALYNIIKGHASVGYSGLWNAFTSTDTKPNGKVWDMYSYKFSGAQLYEYTHFSDQCGTYSQEGDCYNREHTWPQSFFNSVDPMQSDMFHVYPTDGEVNGIHGNLGYGKVISANKVTLNGSKRGSSNTYPSGNDVFEPIDSFKGDIARSFFYMSTRYTLQGNNWSNWDMANGADLTPAAIALLLDWHHADPVSAKEINRNNAIYIKQGNRNPFIDQPLYADCIWGTADCSPLRNANIENILPIEIYPNPSNDFINVSIPENFKHTALDISVYNLLGQIVLKPQDLKTPLEIKDLKPGVYYLRIVSESKTAIKRLVKN
jgi:endonuclease I